MMSQQYSVQSSRGPRADKSRRWLCESQGDSANPLYPLRGALAHHSFLVSVSYFHQASKSSPWAQQTKQLVWSLSRPPSPWEATLAQPVRVRRWLLKSIESWEDRWKREVVWPASPWRSWGWEYHPLSMFTTSLPTCLIWHLKKYSPSCEHHSILTMH